MKIYVAGNYKYDRSTVAEIAQILERAGHTITFKWWEVEAPKRDKALLDLNGVAKADILVVYMREARYYRGTWVEVGYALARRKLVYFIGECNSDLVFRHHPLCGGWTSFPDRDAWRAVAEHLNYRGG